MPRTKLTHRISVSAQRLDLRIDVNHCRYYHPELRAQCPGGPENSVNSRNFSKLSKFWVEGDQFSRKQKSEADPFKCGRLLLEKYRLENCVEFCVLSEQLALLSHKSILEIFRDLRLVLALTKHASKYNS